MAQFPAVIELSSLDGTNGFQISGEADGDLSGRSVASAGDVNGDGLADVIVGALGADPHGSYSGASYVVFGQATGFAANLDLSGLDGTNGFQISGEADFDGSGVSVASAGDVNGDGFDDVIVGGHEAGPHGAFSGASYVIFGRLPDTAVNRTGTGASQTLAGGDFDDTLSGLGGDDRLFGNGCNDTLKGGAGADALNGGAGTDTASYAGAAAGLTADLQAPANNTGEAAGDSYIAIENLTSGRDTLTGGAGADALDGGTGTDRASYANAASGLTADLLTPGANSGEAAGDTYTSVEGLTGSAFDDALLGNDGTPPRQGRKPSDPGARAQRPAESCASRSAFPISDPL